MKDHANLTLATAGILANIEIQSFGFHGLRYFVPFLVRDLILYSMIFAVEHWARVTVGVRAVEQRVLQSYQEIQRTKAIIRETSAEVEHEILLGLITARLNLLDPIGPDETQSFVRGDGRFYQ